MFETGVKRFSSTRELRLYLKGLLESYEKSRDAMDLITADLLRDGSVPESPQSRGWFKVDELYVNKSDQTRAGLDILLQILRDSTPKMRSVEAALKASEKFEGVGIPEGTVVLLYLKEGVPVRLVVGEVSEKEAKGHAAATKTGTRR